MHTARHTATVRVRYADTDKMKIVYNGNYFVYFEVGRTELLRACNLPYSTIEEQGFMLPVLEAHIAYKSPAYYDDLLDIHTSYTLERKAIVRLDYAIQRNTTDIAIGYTTHSFVNADTMRPVRPPAIFFDAVAQFIQSKRHT